MQRSIEDYLGLTRGSIRGQLEQIAARQPVEVGRQVVFTPVETLLCYGVQYRVNHRTYGGSTSHLAPSPVPQLAGFFSRTNASILAKMANLDGSRTNGAKFDVDVSLHLSADRSLYVGIYKQIIETARTLGITSDVLPDYLGWTTTDLEALTLVDRVSESDMAASVEPVLRKWHSERPDIPAAETERMLLSSARIGQQRFAREVISNCDRKCVFCGFALGGLPGLAAGLLIASHIKPWRSSTNSERVDFRNGLAACPTHDAAFDGFLLTVDSNACIRLGPLLSSAVAFDSVWAHNFGPKGLLGTLLLDEEAVRKSDRFLRWHYREVMGDEQDVALSNKYNAELK